MTQVYYPAKCHRPASTHAGDIRYNEFADKEKRKKERKKERKNERDKQTNKQTDKQTVNNTSPACLLACGDYKKEILSINTDFGKN